MGGATALAVEEFDPEALPPGLHRFWLHAGAPSEGRPALKLPALCWRGAQTGPRLVVTAGIHGDEYEGPEAIWRLQDQLDPVRLRGSLVALPSGNPWAVAAATRATPEHVDGLNLARVFPGDPVGRPTERLAHTLFRLVRRLAGPEDLLVDLHSGGVALEFLPVAGYRDIPGPAARRAGAAARAFGLERLWRMAPHAGTLTDAASRTGIPCVGAEMTGAGGTRAADVDCYVDGLCNVLRYLGILRDQPPPRATVAAHRTTNVLAEHEGHLILKVALGDQVEKGHPLGAILSPLGEVVAEVGAPHAGQIWARRHLRWVAPGDLVAMLAAPAGGAVGDDETGA